MSRGFERRPEIPCAVPATEAGMRVLEICGRIILRDRERHAEVNDATWRKVGDPLAVELEQALTAAGCMAWTDQGEAQP